MEETIMKEYIEFAIENNLYNKGDLIIEGEVELDRYIFTDCNGKKIYGNIIELITSKEFIDSIARGLIKTEKADYVKVGDKNVFCDSMHSKNGIDTISQTIRYQLIDSIFYNELPLFTKQILGTNKKG